MDFFRHVSTLRVDLERRRNIHCKPDEEGNKDQDKDQDEDKDEDDEEDSVWGLAKQTVNGSSLLISTNDRKTSDQPSVEES